MSSHLAPPSDTGKAESIDVSIVIVSWNVRDLLRDCLESIDMASGDFATEVIVIDNGSVDGTVDLIPGRFPHVRLVASSVNLGFAKANNVGLAEARGRYVLFLNPDTVLLDRALARMTEFLEWHSDFAMVGPRLVYPDGRPQPECARRLPSLSLALFEALYLHRLPSIGAAIRERLISTYDLGRSQEVEAISGAAMLARRAALLEVGGFDEAFLHTAEDADLCVRVQAGAGRIQYLADAQIVHLKGQSAEQAFARAGAMAIFSAGTYFERSRGRRHARLYRLIVQLIQMPILLLVGVAKVALRRARPDELRERVQLARTVWRWRLSA
jgi:GT2 family glycosyltransferase